MKEKRKDLGKSNSFDNTKFWLDNSEKMMENSKTRHSRKTKQTKLCWKISSTMN
jgi:hypothetical protein